MWPFRRKNPLPEIPPYTPPIVVHEHPPKETSIVVEEIDTSAMTRTGVHKAWDRLRGNQP
jgi:hypothetical protein